MNLMCVCMDVSIPNVYMLKLEFMTSIFIRISAKLWYFIFAVIVLKTIHRLVFLRLVCGSEEIAKMKKPHNILYSVFYVILCCKTHTRGNDN